MINSKLLAAFLVGLAFSMPAAAKMYKWVDDKGVTHYGETIPPEYANKDREELSKSGRVVKTEEVMTPEKRAAKEEENAKKREAEKATSEQKRRDHTLLSTYNSVNEIDLARKRNLQQVELRIDTINATIQAANNSLLALQNEADGYTKRNKEIPDSLKDDQRRIQVQLDKLNGDLEKPRAEKAALDARYDADKARYIELTGKKQ